MWTSFWGILPILPKHCYVGFTVTSRFACILKVTYSRFKLLHSNVHRLLDATNSISMCFIWFAVEEDDMKRTFSEIHLGVPVQDWQKIWDHSASLKNIPSSPEQCLLSREEQNKRATGAALDEHKGRVSTQRLDVKGDPQARGQICGKSISMR